MTVYRKMLLSATPPKTCCTCSSGPAFHVTRVAAASSDSRVPLSPPEHVWREKLCAGLLYLCVRWILQLYQLQLYLQSGCILSVLPVA